MGNGLQDALFNSLVPALTYFIVGWFLGTINLIEKNHVDGINRYTLFVSIPIVVFITLTNNPIDKAYLFFIFLKFINQIIWSLLLVTPRILSKKWDLGKYVLFYLNNTYNNTVIYGMQFLVAFFPNHNMDVYCSFGQLTDCTYGFFFATFLLELRKELANKRKSGLGDLSITSLEGKVFLRITLNVLLRVIMQPVIWAMFFGLILSLTYTTLNSVIKNTLLFASNSNFAVAMFNIGLFSAHNPTLCLRGFFLRLGCRLVECLPCFTQAFKLKAIARREESERERDAAKLAKANRTPQKAIEAGYIGGSSGAGSDSGAGFTGDAGYAGINIGSGGGGGRARAVVGEEAEAEGVINGDGKSKAKYVSGDDEDAEEGAGTGAGADTSLIPHTGPASSYSTFGPSPAATVAESAEEKEKEAAKEQEEPISWLICIALLIMKAILVPAGMLGLVYISRAIAPRTFTNELSIAVIMEASLPIAMVAFALAKQYGAQPGESVVTIILQTFVTCFPFLALWQLLLGKIFPL